MKITKLVRSVAIASATSTTTTLTVVTTGNHNLVTGDLVSFETNARLTFTVTVTNATTFTVPAIYQSISTNPYIPTIAVYPLGLVAAALTTISTPMGSTNDSLATFQAIGKTSIGTGAATLNVEVSNNGVNWLTFGTITLTLGTVETTGGLLLNAPWAYVRIASTSITGTNGVVTVLMSRGS